MDDKVKEFVESLYKDMEEALKRVYKHQKDSRDKLLKEIAMTILIYTVLNDVLSVSESDCKKRYNLLTALIIKLIRDDIKQEKQCINEILTGTVKKTFEFYSYNYNLEDVKKIIDDNFKGKHFSKRIWNNEQEVAKKLIKQCQDFLQGKINVNQIAKEIKNTYNTSAYNAKRLVETEISRCHIDAFEKFCEETGVEKLKYNAILDSKSCNDCRGYDGKVYEFGKHPRLPRHPCCRCYYDIEE